MPKHMKWIQHNEFKEANVVDANYLKVICRATPTNPSSLYVGGCREWLAYIIFMELL